jgi:hypothetical protein
MMRQSLFEKTFGRFGWPSTLVFFTLLMHACVAEPLARTTAEQPPESIATPGASRTPLPASTSTNVPSAPHLASQTATAEASPFGEKLVEALRGGGYVIYIQSGENDTEPQDSENCPQLPEKDNQTHLDVQAIGRALENLVVPVDRVLHNASCHARDTARQIFGEAESWIPPDEGQTLLRGERMAFLRGLLSARPQPGMNTVLVGRGRDITDVTGHEFVEGEIGIYKPLGEPGYSFVAQILPHELAELERNITGLVPVEPIVSDAVLQEQAQPVIESDALAQSRPGGQTLLVPLTPFPTVQPDLVLPDLITLPPTDLRIRTNAANGHKLLRFTNSIVNAGPGKMELWGDTNPSSGKMTVIQYLYDTEDTPEKRVVGEFLFHPEHDHWHLGDFALYEIWSVGLDGELDSVAAVSNKISYCLRDDERWDLPDAPVYQTYISCDHERQGISVGWIDIYRYHLPGQSIDITFLFDGIYALRSTVNPENRLWETDRENNTTILYIEIEGNRVSIVDPREVFNKALESKN